MKRTPAQKKARREKESTPEAREKASKAKRDRYAIDPKFRDRLLTYQSARYAADPELRAQLVRRSAERYHDPSKRRQIKDAELRRKFRLTLLEFEALIAVQGGRCAICETDSPGGAGTWNVDHNHETGEVRGLLCSNCNLMIGHARESTVTLLRAVRYLNQVETWTRTVADMMADYRRQKVSERS